MFFGEFELNGLDGGLLNAAGTPMTIDLPLPSSSARLTLFPGELSTSASARLGSLSPTLTNRGLELWKERERIAVEVRLSGRVERAEGRERNKDILRM